MSIIDTRDYDGPPSDLDPTRRRPYLGSYETRFEHDGESLRLTVEVWDEGMGQISIRIYNEDGHEIDLGPDAYERVRKEAEGA